jgi:[ribosomal protein S5]-alanine N-acetyltransferase
VEPEPRLDGERSFLRPWTQDDVPFVLAVTSDPLIPLISEVPSGQDAEGAAAFIGAQHARRREGRGWAWAVVPRGMRVPVGYVGALWIAEPAGRASIGYWTGAGYRRHGFTADAVRVAAQWLLGAGQVARLEAFIEPGNVGSIRVAERAGFVREGLMRSFAPLGGQRVDAYLYAKIAS